MNRVQPAALELRAQRKSRFLEAKNVGKSGIDKMKRAGTVGIIRYPKSVNYQ